MKLNYECIRDFLIDIEENAGFLDEIPVSEIIKRLSGYSPDDIAYTAIKLTEAGYINSFDAMQGVNNAKFFPEHYIIKDITFSGHEYLNSIRDSRIWSAVKKEISALSSVSLPIIQQIAQRLILKQLNL